MPAEVLTPERVLTLIGFLGVLLLLWAVIRTNKGALSARMGNTTRRMSVQETMALGGNSRAILMQADGQKVLIVTAPKGGLSVLALDAASSQEGAE